MRAAILLSAIVFTVTITSQFESTAQCQESSGRNLPLLQDSLSTFERRYNLLVERLGTDHWQSRRLKDQIERLKQSIELERSPVDEKRKLPKTARERLMALRDKVNEMDEKQLKAMVQLLADHCLKLEEEMLSMKKDKLYLLSK